MKVYGGHICGAKRQGTSFVATGQMKGNYPIHVCDKQPHRTGEHEDSTTGENWR